MESPFQFLRTPAFVAGLAPPVIMLFHNCFVLITLFLGVFRVRRN